MHWNFVVRLERPIKYKLLPTEAYLLYGEKGKVSKTLYFAGISSCNTCPPAIYALVVAGVNFLMYMSGFK
jgi:hypothetical protein